RTLGRVVRRGREWDCNDTVPAERIGDIESNDVRGERLVVREGDCASAARKRERERERETKNKAAAVELTTNCGCTHDSHRSSLARSERADRNRYDTLAGIDGDRRITARN